MAADVLWAPWRMTYVVGEEPEEKGCIFCELPKRADLREALVLVADDQAQILLNRFPYNNGHLMIAPRRHTADLNALDRPAWDALMDRLRQSVDALGRAFGPDGFNLGLNLGRAGGAGIDTHLHWHVVPRWEGDTNFMPVIAGTKVMPELLLQTYDRLKPHFS